MNDKEFARACSEAITVIDKSSEEIQKKISQKFIDFLRKNADTEYNIDIDFHNGNIEEKLSIDAMAILGLIYRDYIVSADERKKLLEEEQEEKLRQEKELREKYNPDDIFKKKTREKNEVINEVQLIEVKETSWFKRTINKILSFFGIKK